MTDIPDTQINPNPGADSAPSLGRRRFLTAGSVALLGAAAAGTVAPATAAAQAPAPASGGHDTESAVFSGTPSTQAAHRNGRAAIAELRRRLRGTVLLPGMAGYDSATAARNGRYLDLRAAVVAQCADEKDVVTAVRWARKHGLPPVVRAGGHSYAGFSSTNGFEIDISRLNGINIDRTTGHATMGGAASNAAIFAASRGGPWLLPGGTCGQVAIGGLTLGGGIGYHTHWAGLTCDHLVSTRMVTADGDIVVADQKNHSDLFWACQGGGGGNFGINTSMGFQLARIPTPNSVYFRLDWRGADAAVAMLTAVDRILLTAPPALNLSSSAIATPVGGGGPREAIDVMCRGHYLGSVADLTDLLAPLLAIPGQTHPATFMDQPFWTTAATFISDEATPHSWGDISRYTRKPVPHSVYGRLVDLLVQCPIRTAEANGALWSLGWIGGPVVDRFTPTQTAYVHRNMNTLLRPTPVWPNGAPRAVGDELMAWTLAMTSVIDPCSPGDSYQNFPNRFLDGWEKAYYGENWGRLRDVKTAYDPLDFFHNPQSIPPRFP